MADSSTGWPENTVMFGALVFDMYMEYSNDNGMEYEVNYALSGGCNRFFNM